MTKTEKLKNIILSKYNSIREFSKIAEIPSTTLTSALDKDIGGMAVDRVVKICEILNIDIKTFEPLESTVKETKELPNEEQEHLKDFRELNYLGKKKVIDYTKDLCDNIKYLKNINQSNVTKLTNNKKEIWEKEEKQHLMPIASHDDNLTDEEKSIMDQRINEVLKNLNK